MTFLCYLIIAEYLYIREDVHILTQANNNDE